MTALTPALTATPYLWFLNRSTGITLMVVLSLTMALGVMTLGGRAAGDGGARLPRFVTRAVHRNLALGALALLVVHVATAVADSYVPIRWWDAVVPWGSAYEPVRVALGTLALDLMAAVAITSALRGRIGPRTWKAVHLTSWLAWLSGVTHGVLIGTDLNAPERWRVWTLAPTGLAVGIVAVALVYRVVARPGPVSRGPQQRRAPLETPAGVR